MGGTLFIFNETRCLPYNSLLDVGEFFLHLGGGTRDERVDLLFLSSLPHLPSKDSLVDYGMNHLKARIWRKILASTQKKEFLSSGPHSQRAPAAALSARVSGNRSHLPGLANHHVGRKWPSLPAAAARA